MVFSDDSRTEWAVLLVPGQGWCAFDADGAPVLAVQGRANRDGAIRSLIGEPR